MSGKLLLKLDSVNMILQHHTVSDSECPHFEVLYKSLPQALSVCERGRIGARVQHR